MAWAVITGGSRGIGAAAGLALAREGFDVVVTYASDGAAAQRVAACIVALGRRCDHHRLDLADSAATEAAAGELAERYAPQILVNNAAEVLPDRLSEVDPAAAERLLRVNTLAPLLLTRGLAAALAGHQVAGAVVNVSSTNAVRGSVGSSVYAASKAALHGLTATLAVELAPGVRVNAVVPGLFRTDMNRERLASVKRVAVVTAQIPLARVGSPDECAEVIAFLASERARYVTGAVVAVDGGLTARSALSAPRDQE